MAAATLAAPRTAMGSGECIDDAAARYREAALGASAPGVDPVAGLEAARLYLARLNELGTKEARTSCFDAMAVDVPKLRERYCRDEPAQRDSESCVLLDKVQVDILRLDAQRLVERADKLGDAAAQPLFEKAGTMYLDTYRQYCEQPARNLRTPHVTAPHCEEMAFNAARAFVAAHRTVEAVVVYKMMVAEDERSRRGSPLAAKAMVRLGASYQSMALYAEAADWYERFATVHPREPESASALSDAAILRVGLGDDAAATRDVAMFLENWGSTRRPEAAQLELMMATHHAEHGEKERARATVRGAMEMLDRGPIDLAIRAHALAATLAETPAVARTEHAKVLSAWADPEAGERALRRGWPRESEGQLDRRLARVLGAVGAARFFAAEERRHAEVDSVKFPVYTGAIEKVALSTYAQSRLRDWYVKKRGAIERVEPEYIKVLDTRPMPAPAWVIAAGAAVGAMWGELADDFRRVPAPAALKKAPALYKSYFDALEAMSGPIRTRFAKPAMKRCLDLSIKYQYFDASSRTCEAWLIAHYKTEFPAVDELTPAFRDPPGPLAALQRPDPPLRAPSLPAER